MTEAVREFPGTAPSVAVFVACLTRAREFLQVTTENRPEKGHRMAYAVGAKLALSSGIRSEPLGGPIDCNPRAESNFQGGQPCKVV